jgi:hypothetical protein
VIVVAAHEQNVTAPEAARHRRAVKFYEKLGFEFTGPKLRLLISDHSPAC